MSPAVSTLARILVAKLLLQMAVIDATAIHAGRGSGLHAAGLEAELNELFGDTVAGFFACTPASGGLKCEAPVSP